MNRLNRIALCAILLLATKMNAGENPGEARISARRFTLEQAIITALQQNPDILRARQEIERTKGLFIQLRAAAMPQILADARFQDLDPHLQHINAPSTLGGAETGGQAVNIVSSERSYSLEISANQVIFSGGRVPGQISSASFQRDGSNFISCFWIAHLSVYRRNRSVCFRANCKINRTDSRRARSRDLTCCRLKSRSQTSPRCSLR